MVAAQTAAERACNQAAEMLAGMNLPPLPAPKAKRDTTAQRASASKASPSGQMPERTTNTDHSTLENELEREMEYHRIGAGGAPHNGEEEEGAALAALLPEPGDGSSSRSSSSFCSGATYALVL